MATVTNIATRQTDPRFSLTFEADGDFAALRLAEAYLEARGFSFGVMQGANPIGIILGDVVIAKWTRLSAEDQNDLHGRIDGPDFRSGPVTIAIRPDAPSSVIDAFRSVPAPAESASSVIDPPGVFLDDRRTYVRLTEDQDRTAQDAVEGGRE